MAYHFQEKINVKVPLFHSNDSISLSHCLSFCSYFVYMCFTNDDFMQWMLLTLTLINETVFDDSIMNSYTYFYFHPNSKSYIPAYLFIQHSPYPKILQFVVEYLKQFIIWKTLCLCFQITFYHSNEKKWRGSFFINHHKYIHQQSWLLYVTLLPF